MPRFLGVHREWPPPCLILLEPSDRRYVRVWSLSPGLPNTVPSRKGIHIHFTPGQSQVPVEQEGRLSEWVTVQGGPISTLNGKPCPSYWGNEFIFKSSTFTFVFLGTGLGYIHGLERWLSG